MKKIIIILLAIAIWSCPVFADENLGLKVGEIAPDFEGMNQNGEKVKLSEINAEGPVILVFYRGGWCPYCNLNLKDLQSKIADFEALGANVMALSVDTVENAAETATKVDLGFHIISNPDASIIEKYNLSYTVPDDLVNLYKNQYGIDLEAASGHTHHTIAIPATFIIDNKGKIAFAYANKDYKVRVKSGEILQELRKLSQ